MLTFFTLKVNTPRRQLCVRPLQASSVGRNVTLGNLYSQNQFSEQLSLFQDELSKFSLNCHNFRANYIYFKHKFRGVSYSIKAWDSLLVNTVELKITPPTHNTSNATISIKGHFDQIPNTNTPYFKAEFKVLLISTLTYFKKILLDISQLK